MNMVSPYTYNPYTSGYQQPQQAYAQPAANYYGYGQQQQSYNPYGATSSTYGSSDPWAAYYASMGYQQPQQAYAQPAANYGYGQQPGGYGANPYDNFSMQQPPAPAPMAPEPQQSAFGPASANEQPSLEQLQQLLGGQMPGMGTPEAPAKKKGGIVGLLFKAAVSVLALFGAARLLGFGKDKDSADIKPTELFQNNSPGKEKKDVYAIKLDSDGTKLSFAELGEDGTLYAKQATAEKEGSGWKVNGSDVIIAEIPDNETENAEAQEASAPKEEQAKA